ncbi:MAG: thioredoxin domain-containing protein [Methanobacterium sp.]|nr:thioredoxin domain-containing protein [Methanobacterium sp.]
MSEGDNLKNYNHLRDEKSPYLMQHADNPVDWYPWGEEAFKKAKDENKPIFLSIGYSTCHWCHVMARESFQDPDIAQLINHVFVPVKVDREERPDVDSTYMAACQIMTGRGGWPLTVFLTPDLKPFFAGTYFPKDDSEMSVGLRSIILNLKKMWDVKNQDLIKSADDITKTLNKLSTTKAGELIPQSTLDQAYHVLKDNFDEEHGGFGGSQKFPSPNLLIYLLRYQEWSKEADIEKDEQKESAIQMVEETLQAMQMGGIWDHIGYGFHRYSVDPEWMIPHFEKMLYDQAQLTLAYLEAYQTTGEELYQQTAENILEYVLRDMTSSEGGFFSAENAESEGKEGKFYLWTHNEINNILNPEEMQVFSKTYNIQEKGNYLDELTGLYNGRNIIHLKKPLKSMAGELGLKTDELESELESIRKKLFLEREKRVRPSKDDKILTDWNGLMIAALSRAGRILNREEYIKSAVKAANFIKETLYQDGRLQHRYRDGEVKVDGYLEDYAFLVWGLLELYEATLDSEWLKWAYQLNQVLEENYWDDENSGFYSTAKDAEQVLMRKKEANDSALPSGNGVALLNLQQLSTLLEDQTLADIALKQEKAFSTLITQAPTARSLFLVGVINRIGPYYEVVIAGEKEDETTRKMLEIFKESYLPRAVFTLNSKGEGWLKEVVETFPEKEPVQGQTTAYVCERGVCGVPTSEPGSLREML